MSLLRTRRTLADRILQFVMENKGKNAWRGFNENEIFQDLLNHCEKGTLAIVRNELNMIESVMTYNWEMGVLEILNLVGGKGLLALMMDFLKLGNKFSVHYCHHGKDVYLSHHELPKLVEKFYKLYGTN